MQKYWYKGCPMSANRAWKLSLGALLAVIVIIYGAGILAPLIAPYSYNQTNLDIPRQGPSRQHLLGTDTLGRDMLSRMIMGSRVSLLVGAAAVGIVVDLAARVYFQLVEHNVSEEAIGMFKFKLVALFVLGIPGCSIAIALLVALALATDQSVALVLLTGFAIPFLFWCAMIGFVVYVHHTHEKVYWHNDRSA